MQNYREIFENFENATREEDDSLIYHRTFSDVLSSAPAHLLFFFKLVLDI